MLILENLNFGTIVSWSGRIGASAWVAGRVVSGRVGILSGLRSQKWTHKHLWQHSLQSRQETKKYRTTPDI